jgi:exo-beta-1,3-glucanase (GH17 family)/cellulose synthase/poly-beta-1,6-N-acetylglucosamine synthase-like glycosyltransferase
MRRSNWIIVFSIALATLAGWAWMARPVEAPDWRGLINGFSYAPYQKAQNPVNGDKPDWVKVDADLAHLSQYTRQIRVYKSRDEEELPKLAARHGLKVMGAAALFNDKAENQREVQAAIDIANHNRNVNRVIVGNETIYRGNLTAEELIPYIREVRKHVHVPVSTAESKSVWLEHKELVAEVDFIAVQLLPYWENIALDDTMNFGLAVIDELHKAYPGKPILISEVGWPSSGRTRVHAEANPVNEAIFLRRWLNLARDRQIDYFICEAFDEPWKSDLEGGVGAYWGVWDADRNPKFPFNTVIQPLPNWGLLAGASIFLALPFSLITISLLSQLKVAGRVLMASLIQAIAIFLVLTVHIFTAKYVTVTALLALVVLIPAVFLLFAGLLTEAVELVEILYRRRFERLAEPDRVSSLDMNYTPKVSIHVPCYNEPPEMVIETLTALSRLDYPNFEVLLLDNNTSDPDLWRPVETFCETLGPRFRFFHFERVKGFKSGALNFGLKQTATDVEVIAVIDSDYCVDPFWLKHMVPHFAQSDVALVQAPQDYRDADDRFKTMCYWEYAGFFQIGMVQRNERNAIIQHGTMTMVRRTALEHVDGWAEWCICEDSELGLRLFEEGLRAVYTNHSYGRGLMPDSLAAYKSQRHRWSYGAVQILKRHATEVFALRRTSLTFAQRYHFIAGWLPWANDAVNLVIAWFAIVWTGLVVAFPQYFDYPLTILMLATLCFFAFKVTKSYWLYRVKVKATIADTLGAAIAGLGLSFTVARAFIDGCFTSNAPFLRTPKMEDKPALARALIAARDEIIMLTLLVGSALLIAIKRGGTEPEANVWAALLLVQALPYSATLALSFINVLPKNNVIVIGQPHTAEAGD